MTRDILGTKLKAVNKWFQKDFLLLKALMLGAVVVAQLVELLLLPPEFQSLNPNIGNEIFRTYLSVNCHPEKTKINKKSPAMAH